MESNFRLNDDDTTLLTPEIVEGLGFKRTLGVSWIGDVELTGFDFCDKFFSELIQDYNDRNAFHLYFNYSCGESNEEQLLCSVRTIQQLKDLYWGMMGERLPIK